MDVKKLTEGASEGYKKAVAMFSFKALIVLLTGLAAFYLYIKGEGSQEAALFFGGLFSTWAGQWLFNKGGE